MKKLLIATSNPGKYKEISEILDGCGYELIFLKDLDVSDEGLVEDGETFFDNALIKARFFHEKTGMLTLAEDSGIIIDALEGELGVKTRRWGAGEHASDEEWIDFFMKRMEGEKNRAARFVCSACLIDGLTEEHFTGATEGEITHALMAPLLPGLPLSSCFLPKGCDKVYAALSRAEKNAVSHRGWAIAKVRQWLETAL